MGRKGEGKPLKPASGVHQPDVYRAVGKKSAFLTKTKKWAEDCAPYYSSV